MRDHQDHPRQQRRYPALVAVSFTATLVIYELAVRRYRITRFLFGMKTRQHPTNGTTARDRRRGR